jgi:hypothetical protein
MRLSPSKSPTPAQSGLAQPETHLPVRDSELPVGWGTPLAEAADVGTSQALLRQRLHE